MATPSGIKIGNLSGKWIIVSVGFGGTKVLDQRLMILFRDKCRSTDPEAGLKLQGINWMLRKAIGLAAVTLHISLHETCSDQSEKTPGVGLHLEILQVPTGGLAQIPESRILDDNESTLLKDFLFGTRRSHNRLVHGTEGPHGRIVPKLTPKTPIKNIEIGQHLRGEMNQDGADGGFITEGTGLWIHSFDERHDSAWTVEQVWGFEIIGGERYHTRRFVVAQKSGAYTMGRVVFSYLGP